MKKDKLYFLYAMLGIGLTVEGSNLQNLFYGFMSIFRKDWLPIFNHAGALGLSSFFLISIVYNGLYDNKKYSWVLAFLTMIISLYVYREIAPFSLSNIDFTHIHGVVLLLSVVLPYFVAFYTEEVYKEKMLSRTPSQPKAVKSHIEKQRDLLQEIKLQEEIKSEYAAMIQGKEPQRIDEIIKQLKEMATAKATIGQQAISETIVTPQNDEVDIAQMLADMLAKK